MLGTCATVKHWNQLPGNVETKLSSRYFTPVGDAYGSMKADQLLKV